MDRMRDRLDKIARLSRSAPSGSENISQLAPRRPSTATRQSPTRQGKAPIPRAPSTIPPVSQVPRRPVPLSAARHRETATPQTPVGAPGGRPPAAPVSSPARAQRRNSSVASSLPTSTRAQPADVYPADASAPQADTLDVDRILELPAQVSAARRQRQLTARADAAPASAPEPSELREPREPLPVQPIPARKRATPAAPSTTPAAPADDATSGSRPLVALPVRAAPARIAPARTTAPIRKATPASPVKTHGGRSPVVPLASRRPVSRSVGAPPAAPAADTPASTDQQATDPLASENSSLPENIESVGGAMQRFLAILAERRRQRTLGGGDGGDPPQPPSTDTEDVCPVCGGAGYVRLDVPVGDPRFGQPVPCKCKEREFEERRRIEEERRVLELDRFFSLKPFGDKTFETFNPRVAGVKEAYEAAQTFAEDPTGAPFRWLVLMGGTGVGKTHLAAAIAHERLQARSSVFFAVVPDLLDHLRAAFAPSAEMPYNEMFETVREVEMLILDDLGSENSTAWATEKLFQIINYRYNYRMPTVITTNSRLFEHMDERIASRLADTNLARTVVIEAPSRRPHPARKQSPPGRQPPPRW